MATVINKDTSPSLLDWQVQTLRLTSFSLNDTGVNSSTWWFDVIGELPDSQVSQPKIGTRKEESPFDQGKLVLSVQSNRIDWHYTVVDPDQPLAVEEVPNIGSFSEELDKFMKLMSRWLALSTCPPAKRIAFGAILTNSVENRIAGYERLDSFLPSVKLDPVGSSDFMYQINRPRSTRTDIPELKINRLSKWSVSIWKGARISMSPVGTDYFEGPEYHALRLELDVNTSQDFKGKLSGEQLPRVFRELVDFGREVSTEGDIP